MGFFARLDALDKNAYAAYQACSNLQDVVKKLGKRKMADVSGLQKALSINASLMTPVKPMLVRMAFNLLFNAGFQYIFQS